MVRGSGYDAKHQFRGITKLITHGKGGQREIDDASFERILSNGNAVLIGSHTSQAMKDKSVI